MNCIAILLSLSPTIPCLTSRCALTSTFHRLLIQFLHSVDHSERSRQITNHQKLFSFNVPLELVHIGKTKNLNVLRFELSTKVHRYTHIQYGQTHHTHNQKHAHNMSNTYNSTPYTHEHTRTPDTRETNANHIYTHTYITMADETRRMNKTYLLSNS